MINIIDGPDSIEFAIRVVPRASKTEIAGEMDGAVKVRVASPPVDGAANKELIRYLAKRLGVPKADIELVSGLAARNKVLRVRGINARQLRNALGR
jgi:uncharacterized protein (TIGR00251 family)